MFWGGVIFGQGVHPDYGKAGQAHGQGSLRSSVQRPRGLSSELPEAAKKEIWPVWAKIGHIAWAKGMYNPADKSCENPDDQLMSKGCAA